MTAQRGDLKRPMTALSHYRIGAPGTAADHCAHPAPTAGTNNQPGDDMTATHTDPLRALLADLTAKLDAATGGEWHMTPNGGIDAGKYDTVLDRGPVECMAYCYGGTSTIEMEPADAALIVALRNHTPALIAAVQAVADLADELDVTFAGSSIPREIRAALAAAVPADTEENAR